MAMIGGARGSMANAAVLSITAGGTSQSLFVANTERIFFMLQNHSAGDLWLGFGATAVEAAPAIKVPAGSIFTMEPPGFIDTQAINIIGATTGQTYTAKQA